MNCETFNDRLQEYLDASLSAADQADAQEHVQKCGDCRRALAQHEAFAKSVRLSFNRETQGLSLRPETRQNILNALEPQGVLPAAREYVRTMIEIIRRQPARSEAFLLGLLLLISGGFFYLRSTKNIIKGESNSYIVIDVPIQTEMYVYRNQNNLVVDAVLTGTSIADASFTENIGSPASSKPHIN